MLNGGFTLTFSTNLCLHTPKSLFLSRSLIIVLYINTSALISKLGHWLVFCSDYHIWPRSSSNHDTKCISSRMHFEHIAFSYVTRWCMQLPFVVPWTVCASYTFQSWIWGSHSSDYEQYYLLGCDAMYSSRRSLMFWRNILPPPSGLRSKPRKQLARHGLWAEMLAAFSVIFLHWLFNDSIRPTSWWLLAWLTTSRQDGITSQKIVLSLSISLSWNTANHYCNDKNGWTQRAAELLGVNVVKHWLKNMQHGWRTKEIADCVHTDVWAEAVTYSRICNALLPVTEHLWGASHK
jgi:hypothetical protein